MMPSKSRPRSQKEREKSLGLTFGSAAPVNVATTSDAALSNFGAEISTTGRDIFAQVIAAACPAIPGPPGLKHLCRVAGCGSGGAIEVRTPKTRHQNIVL